MRTAYAQRQTRFTDASLSLIRVSAPPWMKSRPTDRLHEIVERQALLYAEGTIVWAALVQAVSRLRIVRCRDAPARRLLRVDTAYTLEPLHELRTMNIAKLFVHGGSQAVRLPKEFRFEGTEVYVRRVGAEVVLSAKPPTDARALVDALDAFEPGIRLERNQPTQQVRDAIEPRR